MSFKSENDEKLYQMSWYINPHLFWLRPITFSPDMLRLEHKMNQHYRKVTEIPSQKIKPQVGEMVAFYNQVSHNWYRAIVDFIYIADDGYTNYIIWMLDYGYPTIASNIVLRKITSEFRDWKISEPVLKVGVLGILPATQTYDFINEKALLQRTAAWSPFATRFLKEKLENAESIKVTGGLCVDNHVFADVAIESIEGDFKSTADLLAETKQAIIMRGEAEFLDALKRLETMRIERFMDNERHNIRPQLMKSMQMARKLETLKPAKNPVPMPEFKVFEAFDDQPINDIPKNIPVEEHHMNKVTRWLEKYVIPEMMHEAKAKKDSQEVPKDTESMPILMTRVVNPEPQVELPPLPGVPRKLIYHHAEFEEPKNKFVPKIDHKNAEIDHLLQRIKEKKARKEAQKVKQRKTEENFLNEFQPADYGQILAQKQRSKRQEWLEAQTSRMPQIHGMKTKQLPYFGDPRNAKKIYVPMGSSQNI
ncbi:uncharacterized protein LOC134831114 [Culicoides brevitarsis]|uniref:uncharacterized protein LOC134831114 n=1 Tax=Culicoides brevitarsis TaxID=469753 RepID=UPI00307C01BE